MPNFTKNAIENFQSALLSWYETHKRDLPWRNTEDPYKIWISEIMLQQTQVSTVIPYYTDFIARFPDVSSLAEADLDDVLKSWEGLGYYSRARNMHKAANVITGEFQSQFPSTLDALITLPGIGSYTAGAIASIAFGQNEIAVDGNVRRVMARILKLESDPHQPKAHRVIEDQLWKLLPKGKAGTFNQALMELGARICTTQSPSCESCPVEPHCAARTSGRENELPIRTPRRARPHFNVAIGIIWKDGRVLIAKRPPDKLLGGLWEFPGGKQQESESIEACLTREIAEELAIEIERALEPVHHGYTHFTVTLHPFECAWIRGEPVLTEATDCAWIELSDIDKYAFPRGNRKILEALFASELED